MMVYTGTPCLAQILAPAPVTYSLLAGSQLIDDCPVCDRVTIPVPMSGTFQLLVVESNPLFVRYQVTNVSFTANSPSGSAYTATGGGTYQQGGEVALQQSMALDLQIGNGFTSSLGLLTNTDQAVLVPWPQIRIGLDQTNGTFVQVYRLDLVAAPALRLVSLNPNLQTGDLRVEWAGETGPVQLEGATYAEGPYLPIGSKLAGGTFLVVGALTNHSQFYFRLRQE